MSEIKATVISMEPYIAIIDNFMSDEECDSLMATKGGYTKSTGYDFDSGKGEETEWRTSETYYDLDNKLMPITERVFKIVKSRFWYMPFTIDNFEQIQSQKYSVGQQYKPHVDFFNPIGREHTTDNDRIATMIIYLNDDFEGGETKFLDLNISFKPKKGVALYFEYKYMPELNMKTMHAGEPVTSGEKVILTSWIRNKPFNSNKELL